MPAVEVRIVPPDQHDASTEHVRVEGWYDPDSVAFAAARDRSDDAPVSRPRITPRRDVDVILPDEG